MIKNNKTHNPLVSVVIITYNSAKYVLETLESAKAQTYPNIELIISDDCSKDETVAICRDWIEKNKERFVRIKLIESEINTGIPANCNRGYKAAKGKWIKGIAGDDILVADGIENFIRQYDGEDYIIAGNYQKFKTSSKGERLLYKEITPSARIVKIYNSSVKRQYEKMLRECFVNAPSIIFRRDLFDLIGYFDESYRLMEDYPFWLKTLSNGYKISYIPVLMVYYRQNHSSITSHKSIFFNIDFYKMNQRLKKESILPYIPKWDIIFWEDYWIEKIRFYVLVKFLHNKRTLLNSIISKGLICFSIKYWISR